MAMEGINYGRRNPGVSRIEFDQIVKELTARIEAVEAKLADSTDEAGEDKPKRGRRPMESES